ASGCTTKLYATPLKIVSQPPSTATPSDVAAISDTGELPGTAPPRSNARSNSQNASPARPRDAKPARKRYRHPRPRAQPLRIARIRETRSSRTIGGTRAKAVNVTRRAAREPRKA